MWKGFSLAIAVAVALLMVLNMASASQCRGEGENVSTPTLQEICSFLKDMYRGLGPGYGCLVESPVIEPNVCYTSTNKLASHVLKFLCNDSVLAEKVERFLEVYKTDFYDYYQVVLGTPIKLPFNATAHVVVANVSGVLIKHVKATNNVMSDYSEYANLVAIKAVHHVILSERSKAFEEIRRLDKMFDGAGFRDKAFNGYYETYELALAVIAHRLVGDDEGAKRYTQILEKIKPFTTLYTANLTGVGDLNVETASLTALALYNTRLLYVEKPITQPRHSMCVPIIFIAVIITLLLLLLLRKVLSKR
jgi:hypothetical protein